MIDYCTYLEAVYKVHSAVIPDLIRYPEGFEKTGFRLKDCRNDRQIEFIHGLIILSRYDTRRALTNVKKRTIIYHAIF